MRLLLRTGELAIASGLVVLLLLALPFAALGLLIGAMRGMDLGKWWHDDVRM